MGEIKKSVKIREISFNPLFYKITKFKLCP